MLHLTKPENFTPKFEIVSIFLEYQNEIVLLHRQDHKPEPNTHGVPAGKVHHGESKEQAMIRELREETGIQLEENELQYFREVYVQYPTYEFTYHMFHKKFDILPDITINPEEHKSFQRRTPEEALQENLIQDEDTCIKMFYQL
ncbi:MAG: NUDIX hydrolase [Candidatus Peribacteria bacterium]|nr:NUDIX hydrolase [Candidatus Peribacteria bacterium]